MDIGVIRHLYQYGLEAPDFKKLEAHDRSWIIARQKNNKNKIDDNKLHGYAGTGILLETHLKNLPDLSIP